MQPSSAERGQPCLSTLHGFDSLQLLSADPCKPFDANRNGISIGEAAGFVLIAREAAPIMLSGGGESSDAWHMSAPHPQGEGAQASMHAALEQAGLQPSDIGYVNAHGTATPANDRAEAAAVRSVFGPRAVPLSSTKGVTGHTLGAAGIVEAIVTMQALVNQVLPPSANCETPDAAFEIDVITQARSAPLRHAIARTSASAAATAPSSSAGRTEVAALEFILHSAAVMAPGLPSLAHLRSIDAGAQPHEHSPLAAPPASMLPAQERRRASTAVRLALSCANEALQGSSVAAAEMHTVFATDEGTGEICQQMLEALAASRQVSPLVFSNSVVNAPSGYFSIACGNRQSSTVVSLGLESFASGLLCAFSEAHDRGRPVLFISYDPPMTSPMDEVLPVREPIATARVIGCDAPYCTSLRLPLSPSRWSAATRRAIRRCLRGCRRNGFIAVPPGALRRWVSSMRHPVRSCDSQWARKASLSSAPRVRTINIDRAAIGLVPHSGAMCRSKRSRIGMEPASPARLPGRARSIRSRANRMSRR